MLNCALLLGGFDGLHLGHRRLIGEAKKLGIPVCMTTILGGKEGMLFTQEERRRIFEKAGIDCVWELRFTEELKNTSAEDFIAALFTKFQPEAIFCGEDFRFGRGAEGKPELLQKTAPCPVKIIPLLKKDGQKISVSRIKTALKGGDIAAANELLGSEWFLGGEVEHGRHVGNTYGFPTLNLTPPKGKIMPPDGVYAGYCDTPQGKFKTIVNIGARPTFGLEERKIEAYLDGFSGDLYGATVRVYPTMFLRSISRFESEEALKEQLQRDKEKLAYVL